MAQDYLVSGEASLTAMQVFVYSKPDCHLCDELKAELAALQAEVDFTWVERNILEDPALYERFRYLIPVLEIPNGPLLYPPHDRGQVREALLAAQESGSTR